MFSLVVVRLINVDVLLVFCMMCGVKFVVVYNVIMWLWMFVLVLWWNVMNGFCVKLCSDSVFCFDSLCRVGWLVCMISVSGLMNRLCVISFGGSVCLWMMFMFSELLSSVLICCSVFILFSCSCICGYC